jgi:P27 family predicted phage terminase small subunit
MQKNQPGGNPTTDYGTKQIISRGKKLRGTYQPCREVDPQPIASLSRMPNVPDWLGDEGKRIWREQGANLLKSGLLTESDIVAFSRYCQYAGLFERLMRELSTDDLVLTLPNAITTPNPKFKMALDCQNQADKLGKQFGLSPATRKNVPTPPEPEEENAFDKFLREH